MTGLPRPCPLCGSEDARPHWVKGSLRLVQCRACAMVYASPVAGELASGAFYEGQASRYHLSPAKLESDYAPSRFTRELKLLKRFCSQGDVLDIGCSTGGFLFQLKNGGAPHPQVVGAPASSRLWTSDHAEERRNAQSRLEAGAPAAGFRVVGLDVAGPALDYAASRGLEVIREPFLEHDFGGRQFDAITLWAVLEHLVQPREFLAKAARLLRAGGVCFVLVPNLNSLAIRLLGRKYRYVMPDHVNYFTAATLHALAETISPLKVVQLSSMHFNPLVIWQDLRGSGELVPEEERARLLQQTTALKQSPRWKPARWLYDGVEKMLGPLLLADNLVMVLKK